MFMILGPVVPGVEAAGGCDQDTFDVMVTTLLNYINNVDKWMISDRPSSEVFFQLVVVTAVI